MLFFFFLLFFPKRKFSLLEHMFMKEGKFFVFNDTLNTFYLWLYGVRHMVKDHSDSEPHGLLFLISSKGSFMCIIPHTG